MIVTTTSIGAALIASTLLPRSPRNTDQPVASFPVVDSRLLLTLPPHRSRVRAHRADHETRDRLSRIVWAASHPHTMPDLARARRLPSGSSRMPLGSACGCPRLEQRPLG